MSKCWGKQRKRVTTFISSLDEGMTLSISHISAWVSEGHKHQACSCSSSYMEWFPACLVTSVQLVCTVLYKGTKTTVEMTFSVAIKVYLEELHFHCDTTAQLSVKPAVGCWHEEGCWMVLCEDAACSIQLQHTHVPPCEHYCCFRGCRAGSSSYFLEQT